jgi:hypothetical protein
MQSAYTTNPAATASPVGVCPEFVNLPAVGGDPIFGRSRSWWYQIESQGLIRLTRFRRPGNVRGRVCIPVAAAREALAKLAA